ncbi:hypothetical protein [Streptomyces sp. NPDC029674]|uniref:hypothetical protein n=1 Tax=Streptomyces sp. NPDC029674 TaxID=3365297 RepID=UPI00384B62BD
MHAPAIGQPRRALECSPGRIGQDDFAAQTPWLEQVTFQCTVGARVILIPDGDMFSARAGFLITTGSTAEIARARADEALGHLTLSVEPQSSAPAA